MTNVLEQPNRPERGSQSDGRRIDNFVAHPLTALDTADLKDLIVSLSRCVQDLHSRKERRAASGDAEYTPRRAAERPVVPATVLRSRWVLSADRKRSKRAFAARGHVSTAPNPALAPACEYANRVGTRDDAVDRSILRSKLVRVANVLYTLAVGR